MKGVSPLKTRHRKKLFYLNLGILIVIACLISGLIGLDQYGKKIFPTAPYRRLFYSYLMTRVWRGLIIAPITNVLLTKHENVTTTKLPVWEIRLSGEKLAALNRDLPASGRIYQSGSIIINSVPYPAKFRFRGGYWHWKSKQKSWKIRLKGDQRIAGKREFNLLNPTSTTTLVWPLASYIAQSMGLVTPGLQHVHARLNGQYLGLLYLLENYDHDFTVQNGLPEGTLYQDEALGVFFHQSWKEIETWEIRPLDEKQKHQAGKNPDEKYESYLKELLACLDLKNDKEFSRKIETLIDMRYYLKWWAHTIICSDTHQDRTHNNRLYLDPTSAKFRQIPWDMAIKMGDPYGEIDLNQNPLTERLLQIPEYVHARNATIWQAIQGPVNSKEISRWLNKTADLIREDIYCDPHKDAELILFDPLKSISAKRVTPSIYLLPVTNQEFENNLKRLKDFFSKRLAYLEKTLAQADASLVFCPTVSQDIKIPNQYTPVGQVNLRIGGQTGIRVTEIRIHCKNQALAGAPFVFYGNSSSNQIAERQGLKVQNTFSDDSTVYAFNLHELLQPGRMREAPFGPVIVRYPFVVALANTDNAQSDKLRVEVKAIHSLTGREILLEAPLAEPGSDVLSIPLGQFQPLPTAPRKIIWQGRTKLAQDFRVQADELLIIRPGTRIELSEGASLLSYGRVTAAGTATSPIVFTRAPGSSAWGAVALQGSGANGSVFEHCIFEYASDDKLDRVFYSGALSIYNADASIKNCLFRFSRGDDALNTKFSTTDVVASTFRENAADAYDLDFSRGLIAGNLFENNGNDGIDCGTAHPVVRDNRIFHCGDKGISVGERSNPVIENNVIAHCNVGLAVKDQSLPQIRSNEFQFNNLALAAYQKKKVFGGAKVIITDSRFQHNKRILEHDKVSSISLVDCLTDDDSAVKDNKI